jgi:hypothetical protein
MNRCVDAVQHVCAVRAGLTTGRCRSPAIGAHQRDIDFEVRAGRSAARARERNHLADLRESAADERDRAADQREIDAELDHADPDDADSDVHGRHAGYSRGPTGSP